MNHLGWQQRRCDGWAALARGRSVLSVLLAALTTLLWTALPSAPAGAQDRTPTPEEMAAIIGTNGARMGGGGEGGTGRGTRTATPAANTWQPPGIQGVDVSNWDGTVDWAAQVNMGARFAYVKATEGTTYRSPTWSAQYSGAAQHGLIRGSYHFALPPVTPAADQARFFVANGGGWMPDGKTLPPLLDIEFNKYEPKLGDMCYSMTPAQLTAWIREFVTTVEGLIGRRPAIYTNAYWWNTCVQSADFGAYPLHIARYSQTPPTLPVGWSRYHLWQYSESGPFAGDSNVWNGSYADLVAWARASASIDVVGPAGAPLPATMGAGSSVASPNGQFRLMMQGDGNLVVYDRYNRPVWASRTGVPGMVARAQSDGNLVIYDGQGARWASGTTASGGTILLQDDGNLVVRNSAGFAQWDALGYARKPAQRFEPTWVGDLASGQMAYSLDGDRRLVMQGDGNLVLYSPTGAQWATNTYVPGSRLVIQSDGNLVVYSPPGQPLWWSGTHGEPGTALGVFDDGRLMTRNAAGIPVWDAQGRFPVMTTITGLAPGDDAWSRNGRFRAVMQSDGNLVVYGPAGAVWSSQTYSAGSRLVHQGDGNAVIYAPGDRPVWNTGTIVPGGSRLALDDRGALVVQDSGGGLRWRSS